MKPTPIAHTHTRTCVTTKHPIIPHPQAIHLAVSWSTHPAWRGRHPFDCLGHQAPRDVRLMECVHTFTHEDEARGMFEQLAFFDDGDFFLTKGTFRVDDGDPLTYWITHETAETMCIPAFDPGLDEKRLQYVQMGDVSRLSTIGGGLTLWTKRFG